MEIHMESLVLGLPCAVPTKFKCPFTNEQHERLKETSVCDESLDFIHTPRMSKRLIANLDQLREAFKNASSKAIKVGDRGRIGGRDLSRPPSKRHDLPKYRGLVDNPTNARDTGAYDAVSLTSSYGNRLNDQRAKPSRHPLKLKVVAAEARSHSSECDQKILLLENKLLQESLRRSELEKQCEKQALSIVHLKSTVNSMIQSLDECRQNIHLLKRRRDDDDIVVASRRRTSGGSGAVSAGRAYA